MNGAGLPQFSLDSRGFAAHLTSYQCAALAVVRPQGKGAGHGGLEGMRRTPRRMPMEVGSTPPALEGTFGSLR